MPHSLQLQSQHIYRPYHPSRLYRLFRVGLVRISRPNGDEKHVSCEREALGTLRAYRRVQSVQYILYILYLESIGHWVHPSSLLHKTLQGIVTCSCKSMPTAHLPFPERERESTRAWSIRTYLIVPCLQTRSPLYTASHVPRAQTGVSCRVLQLHEACMLCESVSQLKRSVRRLKTRMMSVRTTPATCMSVCVWMAGSLRTTPFIAQAYCTVLYCAVLSVEGYLQYLLYVQYLLYRTCSIFSVLEARFQSQQGIGGR